MLNVDVLRTSPRNGSISSASNPIDSTYGLPAGNACGDCPLGLGKAGLTATSMEVVDGTVAGSVAIIGLPALGVVDGIPRHFGSITFRVPTITLFSRSACYCFPSGSDSAVPMPSRCDCSKTAMILM